LTWNITAEKASKFTWRRIYEIMELTQIHSSLTHSHTQKVRHPWRKGSQTATVLKHNVHRNHTSTFNSFLTVCSILIYHLWLLANKF
jgi:hypothetical protein